MVSGVGGPANGTGVQSPTGTASTGGASVASLQGRIRQDKIQLDDWTTCVSSKTTKGQAEIQKLSGELSATKDQLARALRSQPQSSAPAAATSVPGVRSVPPASLSASVGRYRGRVDVWA
jgi:hypothetical protein